MIKELFKEIEDIILDKRKKYGPVDIKISKTLTELYPSGVQPETYQEFILVVHMLEKLSRLTNTNITKEAKNDAYVDLAGYSILGVVKNSEKQKL